MLTERPKYLIFSRVVNEIPLMLPRRTARVAGRPHLPSATELCAPHLVSLRDNRHRNSAHRPCVAPDPLESRLRQHKSTPKYFGWKTLRKNRGRGGTTSPPTISLVVSPAP